MEMRRQSTIAFYAKRETHNIDSKNTNFLHFLNELTRERKRTENFKKMDFYMFETCYKCK